MVTFIVESAFTDNSRTAFLLSMDCVIKLRFPAVHIDHISYLLITRRVA